MSKNKKYTINFKGQNLEVSEEFYEYYNKSNRRIKYMEEDVKFENIKVSQKDSKVVVIPSREDSIDRLCENGISFQSSEELVEDYILQKITLDDALAKLSPLEYKIIDQLYLKDKTERRLAKEMGINQKNINKQKQKILYKLHEILKKQGF